MSILVFGSISMDLTTYVPRFPEVGETLFGHSFITVPGGKGSNQAVAAARLGVPTFMVGRVGDDSFGEEVRQVVAEQGVNLEGMLVDPVHSTGLAVISVDDQADNIITVISGANMALDGSDVERSLPMMDQSQLLMLQLEVPLESCIAAASAAQERGLRVILDPAPARGLPDEFLEMVDVLTPNELETEAQVGFRPRTAEEGIRAAEMLRERGVKAAIVKLGVGGVCFASPNGTGYVPSFKVDSVDSVAAGDAFNGGLAAALSEGLSLPEAVRWGAAAGAIATTRPGAMPSMPYRGELLKLLAEGETR